MRDSREINRISVSIRQELAKVAPVKNMYVFLGEQLRSHNVRDPREINSIACRFVRTSELSKISEFSDGSVDFC